MPNPFPELDKALRERLLRTGVAPRHVRRYLAELTDHLADLTAEEEQAAQTTGLTPTEARAAALRRLGTLDDLAHAMTSQPHLQSWSARAPWAVFGLAPLALLAAAWCLALTLLWIGWQVFLPTADTPFVAAGPGPHHLFEIANVFFQLNRALFFGAPVFVGWAIGLAAARQRMKLLWPATGLLLTVLLAGAAQVHAIRVPDTAGRHVSLSFNPAHFTHGIHGSYGLIYALVTLTLTTVPYILWRLHAHRTTTA